MVVLAARTRLLQWRDMLASHSRMDASQRQCRQRTGTGRRRAHQQKPDLSRDSTNVLTCLAEV
jgi:hypothetical protein